MSDKSKVKLDRIGLGCHTHLITIGTKIMTTEQKTAKSKTPVKEVIAQQVEHLQDTAKETKQKVTAAVLESAETVKEDSKEVQANVQEQVKNLKEDLMQRLESLKKQLNFSSKDLTELKDFVKSELNTVIEDLSKLGKELKEDVSQISSKHKDQLNETFKRSKEHTLEVWNKVVPAKEDAAKSDTDSEAKS